MERRTFLATAVSVSGTVIAGCQESPEKQSTPMPETSEEDEGWEADVVFEDVDREVYVEGKRYEFTPGSEEPIRVEAGETVGLAFTSVDNGYEGGHGLAIPEYDIDLRAQIRGVDSTTFVAETVGEFELFCSVYCSEGHHGMTGTIEVVRDSTESPQ